MRNIRRKSITPLWIEDWYDGPLTGFCQYRGKPYYYVVQDDEWKCFMHPLKEYTWSIHLEQHEDFRKHVGDHWDDSFASKGSSGVRPESEWHYFYDKWNKMEFPKADELPPAYRFNMYEGCNRRAETTRREDRLYRLREAKASSKSRTAART